MKRRQDEQGSNNAKRIRTDDLQCTTEEEESMLHALEEYESSTPAAAEAAAAAAAAAGDPVDLDEIENWGQINAMVDLAERVNELADPHRDNPSVPWEGENYHQDMAILNRLVHHGQVKILSAPLSHSDHSL